MRFALSLMAWVVAAEAGVSVIAWTALKAEKAASGGKEDTDRVDTALRMLAATATVAAQFCKKAGYKVESLVTATAG